jgi:hypothetical protein
MVFSKPYDSSHWIEEGLMTGIQTGKNSKVRFPGSLRTHAINDGFLKFGQDGILHVGVTVNGKPKEYSMGVDYNTFKNDPNTESYKILQTLTAKINEINKQISKQKSDHDKKVKADNTQNPNGYNNSDQ